MGMIRALPIQIEQHAIGHQWMEAKKETAAMEQGKLW
jgi:hypothetical protein